MVDLAIYTQLLICDNLCEKTNGSHGSLCLESRAALFGKSVRIGVGEFSFYKVPCFIDRHKSQLIICIIFLLT